MLQNDSGTGKSISRSQARKLAIARAEQEKLAARSALAARLGASLHDGKLFLNNGSREALEQAIRICQGLLKDLIDGKALYHWVYDVLPSSGGLELMEWVLRDANDCARGLYLAHEAWMSEGHILAKEDLTPVINRRLCEMVIAIAIRLNPERCIEDGHPDLSAPVASVEKWVDMVRLRPKWRLGLG